MHGNMYIASFVKPERPLEVAKFRLSSRPQTGIRWPPVSGPRPSFLARSRRGSWFPGLRRAYPRLSPRAHSRGRAPPPSRAERP